jgi:hypothetical protein
MYICIYVYMYIRMYVYMYICMYAQPSLQTLPGVPKACVYIHGYVHTWINKYSMSVSASVIHIHTYIHTYMIHALTFFIHTYTHTHTLLRLHQKYIGSFGTLPRVPTTIAITSPPGVPLLKITIWRTLNGVCLAKFLEWGGTPKRVFI